MLTKEEALNLITEHVSSAKKKKHMLAVSAIMRVLATKLGANEEEWELVGLLHDLDYNLVDGDMRKHGLIASEMLKGKLPDNCLHAIKSHDYRTGIKPENTLDKALIASDCVWSLLVRATLANPHKKIQELTFGALKRVFGSDSFPVFLKSGVLMCKEIGLTLDEFLQTALSSIPADLTISIEDL